MIKTWICALAATLPLPALAGHFAGNGGHPREIHARTAAIAQTAAAP